ncbi:hypothetical protein FACS189485_03490 [Spirochaetia bacterium]|nr:hypothetical protein FACS189485_03490 [Spirochaetia bacterium]
MSQKTSYAMVSACRYNKQLQKMLELKRRGCGEKLMTSDANANEIILCRPDNTLKLEVGMVIA